MENKEYKNMPLNSRKIVKSVFFVIIFWTITALLLTGIYQIVDAIDITNYVGQLFSK